MSNEDQSIPTITPSALSENASRYILLQRIDTQEWNPSNLLPEHKRPFDGIYNNFLLGFESQVRHEHICEEYLDNIESEYNELKPYLPDTVSSILDIGCGMAGIDLYLWDHYRHDRPDVFLFDKSEVSDDLYYYFRKQPAFYNSLRTAKKNLTNSGIPEDSVHTVEATTENLRGLGSIDFCFSLLSWGFHYPVNTYLDEVLEVMDPGGKVILDLRKETGDVSKETDGFKACQRAFNTVEVIKDARKYKRTLLSDPVSRPQPSREHKELQERRSDEEELEKAPAGAV